MPAVSHLLKVLNGPHTGAQSGFGEGESLVIGNSPDADIILSDPHILPQHCSVRISGEECTVVPLDGEVFVSGLPITAPEAVDASRVVTVGSTSFVVGLKDGVWPALVIPDLKNVGRTAEHKGTPEPDTVAKDRGLSPLRILLICLVMLSLVIFAVSVFTAKEYRKPALPEYPGTVQNVIEKHTDLRVTDDIQGLEQTFHQQMPELKTFRSTNSAHGELVVLAPDEESTLKARQLAALTRKGAVYIQVVNLEEVNGILREISQRRAPLVTASLQPNGTLLWKGYLRSRSEFSALKDEERQDLPFLGMDEDKIIYGEELVTQLPSILSSFGIGPEVMVRAEETGIVLSGTINPDKASLLKQSEEKISSLYPDVRLENKVGASHEGSEIETILGGRVAGVTFGKSAWIELTNGNRLFPGTRLPNGMTLLAITSSEIVFLTPGGVLKMSVEAVTSQPVPPPTH